MLIAVQFFCFVLAAAAIIYFCLLLYGLHVEQEDRRHAKNSGFAATITTSYRILR